MKIWRNCMGKAALLGLICGVGLWGRPAAENYLVIDLSGGPKATSYPHRYSDQGPDVSQDTCRTTELWLRKIPAGTFMMGSPADEVGRFDDEELHQVTLTKPFYIGVFEITQKQWELVLGYNPSAYKLGDGHPVDSVTTIKIRGQDRNAGCGWPERGHRVDAGSFLGKIQARTGLVLDLPTEAQWEYACRAGTATALNSGRNLTTADRKCPNMDAVGRYNNNRPDGGTHARVGSYLPNAWGLYDMHGNVREACLDSYQRKLGTSPVTDPVGPSHGSFRTRISHGWFSRITLRGGGWISRSCGCRSGARNRYCLTSSRGDAGFRIVCD